jgi:GntR family transcriptional regulator
MTAIFTVDPHSGVPIYLQLIAVVKRSVALGVLVPGEQLPTVKQLATTLTVNANTVARSYRELERDGVIETSPGRGSFVRGNGSQAVSTTAATDSAAAAIDGAVREAKSMGLDRDGVTQLIKQVLERWYPANDGREAS